MPKKGFDAITIPIEVRHDIDLIMATDEMKYRSRTDVVRDGVKELKKLLSINGNHKRGAKKNGGINNNKHSS